MSVSIITSEELGNHLNNWYTFIKQKNKAKAKDLRELIKKLLPRLERNPNIYLYFSLLDFRYKLLLEEKKGTNKVYNELKEKSYYSEGESDLTNILEYYFHFFSGQYEFQQGKYVKSIINYQNAYDKLHKLPDQIEKAEFNLFIANSYYRIHQNIMSITHAKKALNIFKENENYRERIISSHLMIGLNLVDFKNFDEARIHYNYALDVSSKYDLVDLRIASHFNMALCFYLEEKYEQAIEHFKITLRIPETRYESIYVQVLYMLTHTLYKNNQHDKARKWLARTKTVIRVQENKEYDNKLQIIEALYEKMDTNTITKNLDKLEDEGLFDDVRELSKDVAYFFNSKDKFEIANLFFEKMCSAQNKFIKSIEVLV